MPQVTGGLIVHQRTELYCFAAGVDKVTYLHASATYFGDVDGPADETFVAVEHGDGSQSHYGWGRFSGKVLGREGELHWNFTGIPGSGDMEIIAGTGDITALRGLIHYQIDEGSKDRFTYRGDVA